MAGDVSDSHDPGVPLETWYVPYDQHAETAAAEHVYIMARSHGDALALSRRFNRRSRASTERSRCTTPWRWTGIARIRSAVSA